MNVQSTFSEKVCYQFRNTGQCKYGNACKYKHERNSSPVKRDIEPDNFKYRGVERTSQDRVNRSDILIVGSSILKGINPSKLRAGVKVWSHSGADVLDIYRDIKYNIDVSPYHTVVIHVGGNDAEDGKDKGQFISIYEELIRYLKSNGCQVVVSGILPRKNSDIRPYNNVLQQLCRDENIDFVSHIDIFMTKYGITRKLFRNDLTHLNNFGIIKFLRSLGNHVNLFKSESSYRGRDGSSYIP